MDRSDTRIGADAAAGEQYLLMVDITGYTGFMSSVEGTHGVSFSSGIPAAYSVLGALLNTVIDGVEPDFTVVKLEGDAVFAAAAAEHIDDHGDTVLRKLEAMYSDFVEGRTRAIPSSDHICTACPTVAYLDLKAVLHRGHAVRQTVGSGWDLVGPAVTIAHLLLKNSIHERIGRRPYLFVTDAAAAALDVDIGLEHEEEYAGVGPIQGRIVELGQTSGSLPPRA